ATGVRLRDGRTIKARWVIAACDLDALFTQLLPDGTIPQELVQRYRDADLYSSCVTISLGLNVPPSALGLDEELVFLTRDGLPRKVHAAGEPSSVGLSVLAPSLRDPSMAPHGKGTLTIYAEAPFS